MNVSEKRVQDLPSSGNQTARAEVAEQEPIAITGIGCRFPGADGPEAFWQLLRDGVDAISEIPAERFDVDSFYDPRPGLPGKMYARHGGFLKDVDRFDASFFGISPREANSMDPQQRILLEVAWESIEDAGLVREALVGTRTGVFIGIWTNDYDDLLSLDPERLDLYATTGGGRFSASGRISHFFGFEGPSLVVDTACSSSLTAVHLACQSLRTGETDMVLAGGANLFLHPQASLALCGAKMLSPDGRCKFGDASADGFGRSDGVAVVVLKRLSRALDDNDSIYALIRGSAINNNGRQSGQMVVPNQLQQADVLRQACHAAGITPADLDYVEAHGTGTPVGDPIELEGLAAILAEEGRSPEQPCLVGSVKANIAHTEGAAGVAGLIKLALSLKHGQIPPSLLFAGLSPKIPWDELPLEIPTELRSWPGNGRLRRAGVSSTGLSGTNVHVVVEEAPLARSAAERADGARLLPISASTPEALRAMARKYVAWLADDGPGAEAALHDVCVTAGMRRAHQEHRLTLAGHDRAELRELLEAFLDGESRPGLATGRADDCRASKLVFVFPGQGSQWLGMGRELLATEPVFREAIELCDQAVRQHVGWSVLEQLAADEASSQLDEMDIVQPILFSVEVALAALWRSWGVEPDAVVGHSMGEVAAAYVAGALSLDDATRIICLRSRLLKRRSGQGSMALVELTLERAQEVLTGYEDRVSIAVSNSPTSTVLAGDPKALEEIVERLEAEDVFCRPVKVTVAAHSPQIDALLPDLLPLLEGLAPRAATRPFFSTVDTLFCEGPDLDADYWARNLRQPVLFGQALERLTSDGFHLFLEISPHPILLSAIKEALGNVSGRGLAVPCLRRQEKEKGSLLASLGALHTVGYPVDWRRLYAAEQRCVSLPAYAWQRDRFWLRDLGEGGQGLVPRGGRAPGHPLLGHCRSSAIDPELHFWDLDLASDRSRFLEDHRVQEGALLPAAGFLEMALAAGQEALGSGDYCLAEVAFEQALLLPDESPLSVQLVVSSAKPTKKATFGFYGRRPEEGQDGSWALHARGVIHVQDSERSPGSFGPPAEMQSRFPHTISGPELYRSLMERGYQYGSGFQGLEQVWWNEDESLGLLKRAEEMGWGVSGFLVHPALLDAALQALLAGRSGSGTYVPVELSSLRLDEQLPDAGQLWSHTVLRSVDEREMEGDVFLLDVKGRVVLEALGLKLRCLNPQGAAARPEDWLYEVRWQESPSRSVSAGRQPAASDRGPWLILSDQEGLGERLRSELLERGESCLMVAPGDDFRGVGEASYEIDPADPEAMHRLVAEISAASTHPLSGVVHLWSTGLDLVEATPAEGLEPTHRLGSVSVLHLVQALAAADWSEPPPLWLVTRGAQTLPGEVVAAVQAPVWGLGRVIANEHPELQCKRLDLSAVGPAETAALCDELLNGGEGDEAALRAERRFEPMLARYDLTAGTTQQRRPAVLAEDATFRLELPRAGVLDDLRLRPMQRRPPGPGEVEIRTAATGLNFLNVMVALGEIPGDDSDLGLECVGTICAVGSDVEDLAVGDEVMAFAPSAFASHVIAYAHNVLPKPSGLSFEETATVTIVFTTSYYALIELGRLRRGERILIHAAAGGVGLAAVAIAQAVGAEIFATAGNEEKRAYLRSLGVAHVMDSRSLAFANEIDELTEGEGVDVVLNSLAGEGIPKSLSTLRPYGRFLELGKADFHRDTKLGLNPFLRNLSFFGVDVNHMAREHPEKFGAVFRATMHFFAEHGLKPLPMKKFPIGRAAEAFRYMMQARHIGKIVVSIRGEEVALEGAAPAVLRSDATYLITGGLGGVGLVLAEWLVASGVRHLVLLGRSGASGEAREVLERLETTGARIEVVRADVSDRENLAEVFARVATSMPELRGIVHGAMVLDDGILQQLDRRRFERVMAPKILGAWNLHLLSRNLPLDFFVLFSSAAALVGSPGQGNYVAANAFLDALAHRRQAQGLPALSISWGPWGEVGAAVQPERGGRLAERGMKSFKPEQGLELFGRLLAVDAPQIGVMPMDWRQWQEFNPTAAGTSLFASLLETEARAPAAAGRGEEGGGAGLREELLVATPDERHGRLEDYLRETMGKVMGFSAASVDLARPLNQLGLDSLMAVELRNRIERDLAVTISIPKLLQGLSASQLVAQLEEQLEADLNLEQMDQLSDDQVDTLLQEMLSTQ